MNKGAFQRNLRTDLFALCFMLCAGMMWGCGDSDGDNDPTGPNGQLGTFELTVSANGGEQWSHGTEGGVTYHLNGPEGYCAVVFSDLNGNDSRALILYFKGGSCPDPGRYNVSGATGLQNVPVGEVWALSQIAIGATNAQYRGESGTIEITSREDGFMVGTLTMSFVGLVDPAMTMTASGQFEAKADVVQLQ